MPNACSVPTNGSDEGEYSFAKTSGAMSTDSRKSYGSITEPTVEATTARRNCTLCSASDRFLAEIPAVAIAFLPVTCILSGRSHRGHCTAKYCHGGRTGTRGAGRLLNRDNPRRRPPCGPGHGVRHAKPCVIQTGIFLVSRARARAEVSKKPFNLNLL